MKYAYKSVLLAAAAVLVCAGPALSADKYVIDTVHSHIGFSIKHLGINTVRGEFHDFSGVIMADEKDLSKCSVEVVIQAASIDTDNEKRNAHLKSADFFNAEKIPTLTFKSTSVKKTGSGYTAAGNFTMHGVTKVISIPFTYAMVKDPQGKMRIGVEAALTLNRQDYGVKWNSVMDNGGLLVGNDVKIELDVEAVKQ